MIQYNSLYPDRLDRIRHGHTLSSSKSYQSKSYSKSYQVQFLENRPDNYFRLWALLPRKKQSGSSL